jgi:hypothetical protein
VPFLRWINRLWNRRQIQAHHRYVALRSVTSPAGVPGLICRVFGSACSEAISVARCESGFSITAANGQYLGIFQMGSSERARFATLGYSTAYAQIVAAHNYYLVSGWAPWACA